MGRNSPSRIKYKQKLDVKCIKCGKVYQVSFDTWKRNGGENHKWYCRSCTMNNLSDETKAKRSEKIKRSIANKSDEEKEAITKKRLNTISSQEYKDVLKAKKQDTWKNKSIDELQSISEKTSINTQKVWNESEKDKRISTMHDGFIKWHNSVSEEENEIQNNQRLNNLNNWWNSLTIDQKYQIHKLSKSRNNVIKPKPQKYFDENKFHQRFERQFSESHLYKNYHLEPNYSTTNNDTTHCWDYAILDEHNQLWMVIDLEDGNNDLDDELNEKRGKSIPDGVRCCIITEKNFGKCFDYMCKTLLLNYGEYVEHMFEVCRSMPFPYPEYTDAELIGAYKSLCKIKCDDKSKIDISLNTRSGDRLIQHFHHSIWHDHRGGELSPYEAWQDDELLLQIIQNRIIYQNYLNLNKILQGFNIAKKAAKVSVFSAGRAKMIVSKYLSEFDTVFDPFSGYSGRMLGTISSGKRYIGQDISLIHTNESNDIIDFLKSYGIKFDASISQADVMQSSGEYPCLFTCSPYSDKEQWEDVPVDMKTCDDWIDICLSRFKCKRYVFVVDETTKYNDNIEDVITNKSHFGSNSEYVIIIEGGNTNI